MQDQRLSHSYDQNNQAKTYKEVGWSESSS